MDKIIAAKINIKALATAKKALIEGTIKNRWREESNRYKKNSY